MTKTRRVLPGYPVKVITPTELVIAERIEVRLSVIKPMRAWHLAELTHLHGEYPHQMGDSSWKRPIRKQDCTYCGAPGPGNTVDHVIPYNSGGANHPANCVSACGTCNGQRDSKTLPFWLAQIWSQGDRRRARHLGRFIGREGRDEARRLYAFYYAPSWTMPPPTVALDLP